MPARTRNSFSRRPNDRAARGRDGVLRRPARGPALRCLALLLALGCGAFAQAAAADVSAAADPSGATALLEQARERWARTRALEAEFTQVQRFAGFEDPLESKGRLRILRPSYFELRFEPPNRQLQVCDGQWVWTYVEAQNQVIQAPLAPDATRGADLLEWALAGARALSVTEDASLGVAARRIDLRPGEHLPLKELALWVAPDSPRLLGYEAVDTEGNRTRIRLDRVKERPDLEPSDFRFSPPQGTEVVVLGPNR
jgi:outer membrane lipoprotein carrier protein